jgi:uncharacterized protein YhhL (DUF1145 family)
MSPAKAAGLAFLATAFAAFFVDSSHGLFALLRVIFWLILAAHAIEAAVSLPRLRAAPGSTLGHLAKVMIFGVFHLRELPKAT